ncbi:MAG: hypothetical protein ABF384_08000, partial [Verrucomicrobiales bacterium]
ISSDAPLTIFLIDKLARPVEGVSAKVTESGTRIEVPLPSPIPAGEKFALRIELPDAGDAKVYAIYVTP